MTAGLKSGSLFSGAAGLDLAVAEVLGATAAWFVENDPAASTVLAHHYPDVPNHGDITAVDWADVEPIDILTGGFPCQDISNAGRRAGLRPGTRSGLWSHMAYAISQLRPRMVVIENVDALRSTAAHSDVERCPWCMGDEDDEPALRALGAVLADLAALGFDAEWTSVPAAGVGACHLRWRVFIVAYAAGDGWDEGRPEPARLSRGSDAAVGCGATAADTDGEHRLERRLAAPQQTPGWRSQRELAGRGRTSPVADAHSTGLEGPEPAPGRDLSGGSAAADTDGGRRGASEPDGDAGQPDAAGSGLEWGPYGPAIARWEHILGRPAPVPTVRGARGGRKLNPALPEWMMGFPEGWITDVPGVTINEALKLAGNAVCQQQAAAALRWLVPLVDQELGEAA